MQTIRRCVHTVEGIQNRLLRYKVKDNTNIPANGRAAVLLAICQNPPLIPSLQRFDPLSLVFCQRSSSLRNHAGEVCFPGGKRDFMDTSDESTALREVEEEIGVSADNIQVIGQLDQIPSKGSLLVTPFVGLLSPSIVIDTHFNPNEEVDKVFRVPLQFLIEQHDQGDMYRKNAIQFEGHFIWGLTFELVVRFLDIALDLDVPAERYQVSWNRTGRGRLRLDWMDVAQQMRVEDQRGPLGLKRIGSRKSG